MQNCVCAIIGCGNDIRHKNLANGGITYHRFPEAADIKEKWIDATGRKDWSPNINSVICSMHFSKFLQNPNDNTFLPPMAIPTKNIPGSNQSSFNFTQNTYDSTTFANEDQTTKKQILNPEIILSETAREEQTARDILKKKEDLISTQRQKIKALQSQNRRLRDKLRKIEQLLKPIHHKISAIKDINLQAQALMKKQLKKVSRDDIVSREI